MSAEFIPSGLPGAPDSSPGDTMMMDAAGCAAWSAAA